MSKDAVFLFIIAFAALCFALVNGIQFLVKRNKTAQAVGTITSIKTPNPPASGYRNSKWAKVSYNVDGKTVQSQNRIQVPITSQVGTPVTVRYDKFKPEKLYSFSGLRIIVSLFLAVVCALAAMLRLV